MLSAFEGGFDLVNQFNFQDISHLWPTLEKLFLFLFHYTYLLWSSEIAVRFALQKQVLKL